MIIEEIKITKQSGNVVNIYGRVTNPEQMADHKMSHIVTVQDCPALTVRQQQKLAERIGNWLREEYKYDEEH